MKNKPLKILLVAGYGRSGSTLLDRLLGQIHGFASLGEFYWVWDWGFVKNQLCGCGEPFRQCRFWRDVVTRAFGSFAALDIEHVLALQQRVEGSRYALPLGLIWKRRTLSEYAAQLSRLYRAIAEVAGCQIIVDSSKFPSRGFVLKAMADMELYVVHIVRDSRAVAYSWQRKRARPEIVSKQVLMPRKGPIHSALVWNAANSWAHFLAGARVQYRMLRYEDFVSEPRQELRKIAEWIGAGEAELGFVEGGKAELGFNHTVAGNPMRFQRGAVEIRLDEEWETKLGKRDRALISALTWPLLFRYGYLGRS